jgi:hypothetical protein
VAFASALERFCIRRATILETILFWLAAAGLLWTSYWTEAAGFVLLLIVLALQLFHPGSRGAGVKENNPPLASAAD